jgi:hypothetical protein
MGGCRYCGESMTYEAFQAHRCPLKVEGELFVQRFPGREMDAKVAFVRAVEKRRCQARREKEVQHGS